MSRTSDLDTEVQAVMNWWRELNPDPITGRRGDLGARAALRRAESPLAVLMLPAFHDLLKLLRQKGLLPVGSSNAHLRRLALVAVVICEYRGEGKGVGSFASALGYSADGDRPHLSPLRFQSLMAAMSRADEEEQMKALRRAMAHVKSEPFHLRGLIRDLLTFSDQTRIRWTFAYYGTNRELPPAPPVSETMETTA